ncbi:beta-propeller domain-containing protein [Ningiella sp. W23]|uniref:beta-propeller domain-containing protein n=1 Tax=Ningiella sp. W23 TaxID=3023715 RepID=UPI003756D930
MFQLSLQNPQRNTALLPLPGRTKTLSTAVFAAVLLSGCSGDSSTNEPVAPQVPEVPSAVPPLNPPQAFNGSLTKTGGDLAETFIKNGLYNNSVGSVPVPTALSDAPASEASAQGGFSSTNTQELGVDEADRIEFNGAHFFIASFPVWVPENVSAAGVRVLSKAEDNSLSEITVLETASGEGQIYGIYLSEAEPGSTSANANASAKLAVISTVEPTYPVDTLSSTSFAPQMDGSFFVEVFDVSAPEQIPQADKIEIDGRLISSRRIDNQLYVVSSYLPQVEGLEFGASDAQTQLANYQKIVSTPASELLPPLRFNDNEQNILALDDCYIPEAATVADGYAQLIQVFKIDLDNPQNLEAICMSNVTSEIYMSSEALYLLGNVENDTLIHKISFSDTMSYEASGSVPGIIGWRNQAQLRLSEYQDTLRIVTSDYASNLDDPLHRLFTLQQQGDNLAIVGELPNDTYPAPLGKPGEDVFAVRYVGERGYVVTFEQIDPLYVLGLENPQLPSLLGELEIPGFSSYLQPFSDDLLLGIGQQLSPLRLPETGGPIVEPVPVQAMKISLFDVRDPANPLELANITKENSYTPVEFDYRTLSVLGNDDATRFALPVESWMQDDSDLFLSASNSLFVFDVQHSQAQANLTESLTIEAPSSQDFYIYAGEDRSVQTSDGIYYLRGNQLWYQSYLADAALMGPY